MSLDIPAAPHTTSHPFYDSLLIFYSQNLASLGTVVSPIVLGDLGLQVDAL